MRVAILLGVCAFALGCGPTAAPTGRDGGRTGTTGTTSSANCAIDTDCPTGDFCQNGTCVRRQVAGSTSGGSSSGSSGSSASSGSSGSSSSSSSTGSTSSTSSSSSSASSSTGSSGSSGRRDAGPPVSCGEPFDAGPGPFTFDFDGGLLPGTFSVADVQDPSGANYSRLHYADGGGTRATLYGVVATTPKTLISDGGFVCTYGAWVSDPGGGPYSGMLVVSYAYRNGGGACPDDAAIPSDLQPGQVLKLTGFVKEFCLDPVSFTPTYPCPGDSAMTELKLVDGGAQVLGTAPVPAPTVVDPGQIGTGSSYDNAPYDGVLLQVRRSDDQMMSVTSENPDAPDYFGNWILESHLWLSHQFRYDAEPAAGDPFLCTTGVFTYDHGNWKLEPRTDRDLATAP